MTDDVDRKSTVGISVPIACGELTARALVQRPADEGPIVVMLHGGGYTWRYFDVPGASLFERAADRGLTVVAVDRPGYGRSSLPPRGARGIRATAKLVADGIGHLHELVGNGRPVVLISHSIGAAVALVVAAGRPSWPLAGVAVSGVGLVPAADRARELRCSPPLSRLFVPAPLRRQLMFGPAGTYEPELERRARKAGVSALREEIMDIGFRWPEYAGEVLANIAVPVHFGIAEHDALWVVEPTAAEDFAAALSSAPRCDSAIVRGSGHGIDFHHPGTAFHAHQLDFAVACSGNAGAAATPVNAAVVAAEPLDEDQKVR
jgi:pimeloyl-ACP methyl ester carboxylesterase